VLAFGEDQFAQIRPVELEAFEIKSDWLANDVFFLRVAQLREHWMLQTLL